MCLEPLGSRSPTFAEFLELLGCCGDLLVTGAGVYPQAPGRARGLARAMLSARWSDEVLLWLLYQGHAEPVEPGLLPAGDHDAVFVLTQTGAVFAERLLRGVFCPSPEWGFQEAWASVGMGRLVPRYDSTSRAFRWGAHLIKRFRQPSANQELILCAAEEMGWPDWFDDPLPRGRKGNPKVRLHDTIKDLNRRQHAPLIHWKGDGTGSRVGWELVVGRAQPGAFRARAFSTLALIPNRPALRTVYPGVSDGCQAYR